MNYMVAESIIEMEFYGSEPVGIELPQTVDLKVVDDPRPSRAPRRAPS